MHFDNLIKFLGLSVLVACSGCMPLYAHGTSTVGSYTSTPFSQESDTNTAGIECRRVRELQDDTNTQEALALLRQVGLLPTEITHSVNYRDSVALICTQDDTREHSTPPQPRIITAEQCTTLLGPGGLPDVDVDPSTATSVVLAGDPRVQQMMLQIAGGRLMYGMYMADAQRYCQDRELGAMYGGFGFGGMGGFGGYGGMGGFALPPTMGFIGGSTPAFGFVPTTTTTVSAPVTAR
jgi:hypothetical protein